MLTNILLLAVLVIWLALAVGSILLFLRLRSAFLCFVTPQKEGEASALAKTIDAIASMLARSLVAQLKTSAMGSLSGDVRGEKSVQGAMALDMANQSPALSTILGAFPQLQKTLKRNPQMLDFALGMMQKLGNKQAQKVPSNGGGSETRFKL